MDDYDMLKQLAKGGQGTTHVVCDHVSSLTLRNCVYAAGCTVVALQQAPVPSVDATCGRSSAVRPLSLVEGRIRWSRSE